MDLWMLASLLSTFCLVAFIDISKLHTEAYFGDDSYHKLFQIADLALLM